ncbi:hypothetical protein EVAR_40645_1 [Eumeta japonica]|uniref:Uncharacterized protein n=1 Tax=Eumeta variegata TaxID=151549 RepID=A0A4C1X526_EUMVA|nr:hypothetical protein EVAR_40645_1 [Eumeta japonica]
MMVSIRYVLIAKHVFSKCRVVEVHAGGFQSQAQEKNDQYCRDKNARQSSTPFFIDVQIPITPFLRLAPHMSFLFRIEGLVSTLSIPAEKIGNGERPL